MVLPAPTRYGNPTVPYRSRWQFLQETAPLPPPRLKVTETTLALDINSDLIIDVWSWVKSSIMNSTTETTSLERVPCKRRLALDSTQLFGFCCTEEKELPQCVVHEPQTLLYADAACHDCGWFRGQTKPSPQSLQLCESNPKFVLSLAHATIEGWGWKKSTLRYCIFCAPHKILVHLFPKN